MAAITTTDVARYSVAFNKNPVSQLAKSALNKVGLQNLVMDADKPIHRVFKYTVDPHVIDLTNQYRSGRCWIFSFTNLMRRKMIYKYNLQPSFKLSQKYMMFYDRLEKCNALMEIIYFLHKKKQMKMYSFEMTYIRREYMSDGGTWDFFKNLVLKYGVVPYEEYPDNEQAKNSDDLGNVLQQYVNSFVPKITKAETLAEFEKIKHEAMMNCYSIIESFLGKPPATFKWEYVTAKKKYQSARRETTPLEFYEQYVRDLVNVSDYITLINDPRNPYYKIYSVELLHNVLPNESSPLDRLPTNLYFNVPVDVLREATYNSIRKNMPVPFAGDVSIYIRPEDALMDTTDRYEDLLGVKFVRPRKFLFDNVMSTPNHAMLFIGCNGEHGDWQVENSWKQYNQDYKYFTLSDDWFEHYVGEVIVHKRFLSPKLRSTYATLLRSPDDITYYPLWDIFGTLANMRKAIKHAGAITSKSK
jgi:bleomycin hydrolase